MADDSTFNEAEIQLLATLYSAEENETSTNRQSLLEMSERYWIYAEDWRPAFASLADKGLIEGDERGYRLSEAGSALARDLYAERPDRYFYYYRDFYRRAYDSAAHSKLCEHAFGQDLTQEGQMDMNGVQDLLKRLDLQPGQRLLDLGCGAGGIAEYMSDQTGARVTGVDYSAVAIEVGNERTASKRDRVDFIEANLNRLELEPGAYDAAVMIDSVYWLANTDEGLTQILKLLKPGGQLIILIAHMLYFCESAEELEIDNNFVSLSLDRLDVEYSAHDLTPSFVDFWRRIKQALDDLHDEFVAEGNEFIYQSLLEEAETEFLPAIKNGDLRRFLYHVRV